MDDTFSGSENACSMSINIFSPVNYIPLYKPHTHTTVIAEDNKPKVWVYSWDNKVKKKYFRALIFSRDYFYYPSGVECRGTVKKAILKPLCGKYTMPKHIKSFSHIVTNDLFEIDNIYSNRSGELIIHRTSSEALLQYHRLIRVLKWLDQNVPLYQQRNKSWDILGKPLSEYVMNVDTPLATLESNFQSNV